MPKPKNKEINLLEGLDTYKKPNSFINAEENSSSFIGYVGSRPVKILADGKIVYADDSNIRDGDELVVSGQGLIIWGQPNLNGDVFLQHGSVSCANSIKQIFKRFRKERIKKFIAFSFLGLIVGTSVFGYLYLLCLDFIKYAGSVSKGVSIFLLVFLFIYMLIWSIRYVMEH